MTHPFTTKPLSDRRVRDLVERLTRRFLRYSAYAFGAFILALLVNHYSIAPLARVSDRVDRYFFSHAQAQEAGRPQEMNRPRTLVIHHTGETHERQAKMIEANHKRRGYAPSNIINPETGTGWHIAYHFLVGKDGTVQQNRDLSERTMHTKNSVTNLDSIAIVAAGNFEIEEPSREQMKALRDLIKKLDREFRFERIIGHEEASPTACPGEKLEQALKDVWRGYDLGEPWNITRYYTPVRGQSRYYRTVNDKEFIHKALAQGLLEHYAGNYWFSFAEPHHVIGKTLQEADAWFNDRPEYKEAIRKELEYLADFKVNCLGDCFITADGTDLRHKKPMTVAACPPTMPFGTKLQIEGIGEVVCHDRGGAIKGKRLDIWAGAGDEALDVMKNSPGGILNVKIL